MTGVVSVVGVTPLNATPNAGRLAITLRSRDERETPVTTVIERLQQAVAAHPGHRSCISSRCRTSRSRPAQPRAVPVHADRHRRRRRSSEWADAAGASGCNRRRCCATSPPRRRTSGLRLNIKVDREIAGRLGVSMQAVNDTLNDAFGQRQISTIYGQANQYRVILEAMPRIPERSQLAVEALCAGLRQPAVALDVADLDRRAGVRLSAAQFRSAHRPFEHTTAPLVIAHQEQFPAVTISFNLAPRRLAERRGRGDHRRPSATSACRPR